MRLAALIVLILLLCAPVALADTSSPTTTQPLSSVAPWLTQTSTAAVATTTVADAKLTPADPTSSGNLPFTGDDLIPEGAAAVALIAGGVLLRLRWRRAT